MAKFPIDLSKFKKVSSSEHKTILAHPSGHKFIISHKHLSPEMHEQLSQLPILNAKSEDSDKLLKGDKVDKKDKASTKAQDSESPSKKKAQGAAPVHEAQDFEKEDEQNFAEGSKDGPIVEKVDEKTPESSKEPVQDIDLNAAPTTSPDTVQDVDLAANRAPAGAQPESNITQDPALARKRELYNFAAAHLNPASGGDPRGVLGPKLTFGPNGEAPANFNPASWAKAESDYNTETQNKASASNNAAQAAMLENKARQAAGLPALPVPEAAQMQAQATQEAPKAGAGQTSDMKAPTQPQGPSDPYGTQAFSDVYSKGVNEQKAGMAQEGQAAQREGDAQAAALEQGNQLQQANQENYQTHYNNLDLERQNFMKDIQNQHIDPNHFWNSKDTGSKIATGIGLILGGMGGGMTHQENPALKFLNAQIDRDINAQRDNLGKSQSLLAANMRQFGNLRDATDMTRVMQSDIISNQIKAEAAKAQGPIAKARLLQAAGALDMQSAPVLSQIAMRKALVSSSQNGQLPPTRLIDMIVPQNMKETALKQLKDAQDAQALKDNTLNAFDQLVKTNTMANRVGSPIQASRQTEAIRGAALDKLTKDVSGRVTPETVALIGSIFNTLGADNKTVQVQRQRLNDLLSHGMHYPVLKDYGIPIGPSMYNQQGAPKFNLAPAVRQ